MNKKEKASMRRLTLAAKLTGSLNDEQLEILAHLCNIKKDVPALRLVLAEQLLIMGEMTFGGIE